MTLRRVQQQQGLPQPVVLDGIDVFMPNDRVQIMEPPALYRVLPQGSKHDPFYLGDRLFGIIVAEYVHSHFNSFQWNTRCWRTTSQRPLSPITNRGTPFLDLNELIQHLETDIDSQSFETTTDYPHLALTPPSHHPWLPSTNENNGTNMAPTAQMKSLYNELATYLEQESVTATTENILASGYPSWPSIWSTTSVQSGHSNSLVTTDHALAQAASSCSDGPSYTSKSETAGSSFLHKYTPTMALKVEGGFLCAAVGCAIVDKRRDTLKNHFQRATRSRKKERSALNQAAVSPLGFFQS